MKCFVLLLLSAVFLILPFNRTCSAEMFRVMLYTDSFPPYYFEKGDSRTGIVHEIFQALSEETGDTFKFVRVPFKRALFQFDTGKIDIEPMCNPAWRSDSTVEAVYSIPFAVSEEILLFDADHYIPIQSPEELAGKTIGVVSGYHYPAYDPYFATGQITPHPLPNENKLIQMLLARRLGQALMNKDYALYQIKIKNLGKRLIASQPCSVLDMMIRFHPSKKSAVPRFNKALKELMANGTIERIYARYR